MLEFYITTGKYLSKMDETQSNLRYGLNASPVLRIANFALEHIHFRLRHRAN